MATLHPFPPRRPRPRRRVKSGHKSALRRIIRQPIALIFLIFIAVAIDRFYTPFSRQEGEAEIGLISGYVERIIDGDTFVLVDGTRIRVWGLNAPERGEVGGSAATAALSDLILGRHVSCEHMGKSYNRTVGRCLLEDGTDPAAEMIRLGVSTQYCHFARGYYDSVSDRPC